jgi:hypothetical protein
MPSKIEDVHRAFLYRLALKCLADGNGLGERRGTTVHALNSDFQTVSHGFLRFLRYFTRQCIWVAGLMLWVSTLCFSSLAACIIA